MNPQIPQIPLRRGERCACHMEILLSTPFPNRAYFLQAPAAGNEHNFKLLSKRSENDTSTLLSLGVIGCELKGGKEWSSPEVAGSRLPAIFQRIV